MWNRLSSSHKNYKKANSRWWSVWNEPLDWAGTKGIMQPFRLFLAGAPFVPRTEMLPHWGPWKRRFRSICLKAADLCDNLKTRDVNVSLTHRLLNGYFVVPCDRPVIPHMVIPERKGWRKRAEGFREGTLVGAPHRLTRALWRGPRDFNFGESVRTGTGAKVWFASRLVLANVSISTWIMLHSVALITRVTLKASQMWHLASLFL